MKASICMQNDIENKEGDELVRNKLIVPEEIFAADKPDSDESEYVHDTDSTDSPEENETDAPYEQMVFFEDNAVKSPSTEETPSPEIKDNALSKILEKDEDGYTPDSPRMVDKIFDFLELLLFTVATLFIMTTFFFRHAVVEGDSMSGTLEHGEHLIISDLFYSPKAGDIVVFEDYSLPEHLRKPIVKRIIATEGDTVKIDYDGTVWVNGKKYNDEHLNLIGGHYIPRNDHFFASQEEYTVPEGEVFLLGDNRNDSTDSRCFGAIDEDAILGKVIVRIYPFPVFGGVD